MSGRRRVVILDWTHLLEDYLDAVGLTFEQYRDDLDDGWLFGYVRALDRVGVDATIVVVSAITRTTTRTTHGPTGAPIVVLPAPSPYRAVRRRVPNPYAMTVEQAGAETGGPGRRWVTTAAWALAPYLATPVVELGRVLREDRVDAIICQDYEHPRFDVVVAMGRLSGVPVLASFQGGDFRTTPLERFTRPLSVRLAAGIMAGPSSERARVAERYGVTALDVPNPVRLDLWDRASDGASVRRRLGLPSDVEVVVWHGRVAMHVKGLDVLIEAWTRLADGRDDVRLLLVGDGPDREALRMRLGGRTDVVWVDRFVADRSELADLVSCGDVAVLPSRHEGFPVAPLEAMAAGLPVVATDVPGVRDLAPRGEADGVLRIPPEDPDALADALGALLDDVGRRRGVAAAARRCAERSFGLDAVGRRLGVALGEAGVAIGGSRGTVPA
ncbi:MAG: glycosyltransferase family 4 protein [Actinobacteria bacterium]|nr:glycosyltransferase family 4 protein [Actinomycetota bacterium]